MELDNALVVGLGLIEVIDAVVIGRESIGHFQMTLANGDTHGLGNLNNVVLAHLQGDGMQSRLNEGVVDVLVVAGDGCARSCVADVPLYLSFRVQAGRVGRKVDLQGSFGRDARIGFGSLLVAILVDVRCLQFDVGISVSGQQKDHQKG